MKQLLMVGFALLLLSALGCQNNDLPEVIVAGEPQFPGFLAGRWRAYKAGWEFVLEPDGTITSAVIDNGLVQVDPRKKIAEAELAEEGKGVYHLGDWPVQYSPAERELSVEVVVDHFDLDMGDWKMEGHSRDLFVGPVSEDVEIWTAQWFSFTETRAFSKEKEGEEVIFGPGDSESLVDTLVFEKVPDQ